MCYVKIALIYASFRDTFIALLLKSQKTNQDTNGLLEYAKKLIRAKLCLITINFIHLSLHLVSSYLLLTKISEDKLSYQ